MTHLDAEPAEHLRPPDAGDLQQMRRADGPGAEHRLARRSDDHAALRLIFDAGDAGAVEQQAAHRGAGDEAQIGAAERRLQERLGGADAQAAALFDLEIVATLVVALVEIGDFRDADLLRRVAHGVEDVPGDARPLDPPFAARAMQRAPAGPVVLMAKKERQHAVPAPAVEAELTPAVVVARLAAHVDHAVDGGGAADDAAARIGEVAAIESGHRRGAEAPVRALVANGVEIADGNVQPYPIVAPAGLQQQHLVAGIGAQAVGHQAAGGPGADDDVIVSFRHASTTRQATCRFVCCPAPADRPASPPSALTYR